MTMIGKVVRVSDTAHITGWHIGHQPYTHAKAGDVGVVVFANMFCTVWWFRSGQGSGGWDPKMLDVLEDAHADDA